MYYINFSLFSYLIENAQHSRWTLHALNLFCFSNKSVQIYSSIFANSHLHETHIFLLPIHFYIILFIPSHSEKTELLNRAIKYNQLTEVTTIHWLIQWFSSNPRVLIIDDKEMNQFILATKLEHWFLLSRCLKCQMNDVNEE